MIDRTCNICKEYVNDVWTLVINSNKDKFEVSGHHKCIDQLDKKTKPLKDVNQKIIDKLIKQINNK